MPSVVDPDIMFVYRVFDPIFIDLKWIYLVLGNEILYPCLLLGICEPFNRKAFYLLANLFLHLRKSLLG